MSRCKLWVLLVLLLSCGGAGEDGASPIRRPSGLDQYGGIKDLPAGAGTGFFRLGSAGGRTVLVSPLGNAFLALHLARCAFDGEVAKDLGYAPFLRANQARFGDDAEGRGAFFDEVQRLAGLAGFTVVGVKTPDEGEVMAQRPGRMAYTVSLDLAPTVAQALGGEAFPDVFDDRFGAALKAAVDGAVRAGPDPYLVAYIPDDDLFFYDLADRFIAMKPGTPGKNAFLEFVFKELAYAINELNEAWGTHFGSPSDLEKATAIPSDNAHPRLASDKAAFAAKVAKRYFEAVVAAIKAKDPNHLVFSAPIPPDTPKELAEAAGAFDVVLGPPGLALAKATVAVAPCLPASDSGLPNKGASEVLLTQAERVARYRQFLLSALGSSGVVGVSWPKFADEPRTGGESGTSRNCGIVAADGAPYLVVLDGLAAAHGLATDRFLGGSAGVLDAPSGLSASGLTLSWQRVDGADSYEVLLAQAPYFPGVIARKEWAGAETEGPWDVRLTANGTSVAVQRPLAAGRWWFTVRASGTETAFPSDYAAPVPLDVPLSCTGEKGTEAELQCVRLPEVAPGPKDDATVLAGTVYYQALERHVLDLVFEVNSLGTNHPRNGGHGVQVVVERVFKEPLVGGPASDRFCPALVLDADGYETNAAAFVHVRHIAADGRVVVDRVLDPTGTMKPFSCSAPVASSGDPIVRKEYYVDTADQALPPDVRLELQVH